MINDKLDCAFLLVWSGGQGGIPFTHYPSPTSNCYLMSFVWPGVCGPPFDLIYLIQEVGQMITPKYWIRLLSFLFY